MIGTIFGETLRRNWRTTLYWGIGMGLYALMITVAVLDDESLRQIMQVLDTMPGFLIKGLMGTADVQFMTSPDGYFAIKFLSLALVLYSIYAVMAGMAVTASDEESGILDSFLSLPLPRWSVIVARSLAFAVLMLVVLALSYVGILIGAALVPQMSYDLGHIGVTMFNLYPGMLFALGLTVLCGVLFRRRNVALGVTAAVIATSYFLDFIASGVGADSPLSALGYLSYFHYNNGVGVMQFGLEPGNIVLLAGVAAVFLVLSLWRFQKRDIGL